MKKLFSQFSTLGMTLLLLSAASTAVAQEAGGFEDLSGDSNSGALGTSLDVNDLIHLSNRLGGQSAQDFQARQERKISEAAADFRERQRQALEVDNQAENTPTDASQDQIEPLGL